MKLFLDGTEVTGLGYCDYALDEEGYAAGVFRYSYSSKNRPRAGARYNSLVLATEEKNVMQPILRVKDVVIRGELGVLEESDELTIECRWHNGVTDA